MIRQCSKYCKSKYKRKEVAGSGIRNIPGSTNWDAFLHNITLAQ